MDFDDLEKSIGENVLVNIVSSKHFFLNLKILKILTIVVL